MGEGTVRRHVVIRGEVQGVFFRDSTRKEAESRGVSGWVRNRDDGTVEAVFEEPEEAVEAMLEWCRSGPSRADVEDMHVSVEEEPDGLEGFEVR
jgi:acylphosphatase